MFLLNYGSASSRSLSISQHGVTILVHLLFAMYARHGEMVTAAMAPMSRIRSVVVHVMV